MELAEERSLLSDSDECMAARGVLNHPRNRISAEIAWLPGVHPEHIDSVLKQLEPPHQNLLNIIGLTYIARANVLTVGLLRISNLSSSNIVEWLLAIAQSSEAINSDEVRAILNEDRRVSGFPEIADNSAIEDGIQEQKRYYRQVLTSVLEYLSVNEQARVLTLIIDTVTGKDKSRSPILIDDVIVSYENGVADFLKKKQRIIEAQDDKIRAMVDAKDPDTTLRPVVNQLIQTVKDWDTIAQPIQLSTKSRGERHTDSFEIAWRVRELAVHLFNEYNKYNYSLQLLNMLLEVFEEVPEIVETIGKDKKDLEAQIDEIKGIEKFQEINTQIEKLKEAADTKKPDYTLLPMVNQLIQIVKTWDVTTQPVEANQTVAYTVRSIALHLCNEHQKLDFAIQITTNLIELFKEVNGMDGVNNRLTDDLVTLVYNKQKGGCLSQIVFLGILGLIGALLQGC